MILEHTGTIGYKPGVHWDLLCEESDSLRAWEFLQPIDVPQQTVIALPAHRLHYLDYEGAISGERGSVTRVVAGTYELLDDSPTRWSIEFLSASLSGIIHLTRASADQQQWDAVFLPSS